MLTITKPVPYGYKSIHDLPTPPNTSRHSPPLMYQDSSQKSLPSIPRSRSPPMSGAYRGLPPPAAMSSGQGLPPGVGSHPQSSLPPPPPPSGPSHGQGPPPPSQTASQSQQQHHPLSHHMGPLPPHPGLQGSEETMRAWLHAKAEEDKRRQEEERSKQESFRLEQQKTQFDIMRCALQGGIPPAAVPIMFAGMSGGNVAPAALEWAQQVAQQQLHPQQLLPGPGSPEHRRDSHPQAYGHYSGSGGVPSTPGSAQGAHGGFVGGYPGSPRTRGYTMPVSSSRPMAAGSGLSSLNTSVLPSQGAAAAAAAAAAQSHSGVASTQPQEQQQSPSIYFHMWQPPTSQGGQSGSNQPATPSGASNSKKRSWR